MSISPVLKYTTNYKEILFNLVSENLGDTFPAYILDIGCGKGDDLKRISSIEKDVRIYGIDISLEAFNEASKKLVDVKNCRLLQTDGKIIPFDNNSFQVVISSEVIEHIEKVNNFIKEAHRILKPDGAFIVTTPSKFNYINLIGKIIPYPFKNSLRKFVYCLNPGKDDINPHFYEYSPNELKTMFQENGFIVESIIYGAMRVPFWRFFERFPVFLSFWKNLDKFAGKLPYIKQLKSNFIMVARKKLKADSKILIMNLGGIGDVLLSLPALKALRNSYQGSEISVFVTERVYEIVKDLPYINEIHKFNIGYGGVIPFNKILANFKTLLALRKKQFNLAVNMRTLGSKKSALKIRLMLNIIKPGIKAGRNTEGRGAFFDIKIEETFIGQKYEMDYDIEMVKKLGAETAVRNIELMVDKESENNVKKILNEKGISNDDIVIGIHPGGMPSRRWPIENFISVIKEIGNKIHAKFIITGGKDEADLGEKLARADSAKVANLVNKLNIKELEALIKRCNLFISNDTGAMHLAAILKVPLAAIFGPGDLIRFDPRSISDNAVVLHTKKECSPCEKVTCDSLKCLKEISPEEVITAASSLLTRGGS